MQLNDAGLTSDQFWKRENSVGKTITVVRDMTSCSFVNRYQRFDGNCCLNLQFIRVNLKMPLKVLKTPAFCLTVAVLQHYANRECLFY